MKERIVISLDQVEQTALEQIVLGGDEKLALSFLKETVKKKVDRASVTGCRPVFEWGGKQPVILTEMQEKRG